MVTRTLRDAFTADVEEVHIDDLETYHAAQNFFKRTMPQHQHVLKHYIGKKPLFSKYQTEEQIDRVYARKVALPSGGSLAMDQTEALVAIDVNSGKTAGDNVEDMAFKTNMEGRRGGRPADAPAGPGRAGGDRLHRHEAGGQQPHGDGAPGGLPQGGQGAHGGRQDQPLRACWS